MTWWRRVFRRRALERGPHQVRSEHAVRKQIDAGRDHGQHNEYGNSDSAAHYG